ncbi:MAG: hypothetical protein R2715_10340 [Ilumatobacteraceae bacterium]
MLCVGGGDARKNVAGLTAAWSSVTPEVRADHQLVVVGAIDASQQQKWSGGFSPPTSCSRNRSPTRNWWR